MQNEYAHRQRQNDTAKILLVIAYVLAAETLRYIIFGVEYLP